MQVFLSGATAIACVVFSPPGTRAVAGYVLFGTSGMKIRSEPKETEYHRPKLEAKLTFRMENKNRSSVQIVYRD